MLTRIIGPQIKNWLHQELELLCLPQAYDLPEDEQRYLKIKGSGSLDRRGLAILRALTGWREAEARNRNRPRGHIIKDKELLALARERPDSVSALTQLHLLSANKMQRYGDLLVARIQEGLGASERDLPEVVRRIRLSAAERSTYERLLAFLDRVYRTQGIDPHIVGNNSDFKQLVKQHRKNKGRLPEKFTAGWRRELLEKFFSNQ